MRLLFSRGNNFRKENSHIFAEVSNPPLLIKKKRAGMSCCDSCLNSLTTEQPLCQSNCAKLCKPCLEQYFTHAKDDSFAICANTTCPGPCKNIIPMHVWKQYATPTTTARYNKMLLARLSIRCPQCHANRQFAGYAQAINNTIVARTKKKKPTPNKDYIRYEKRLLALGVQPSTTPAAHPAYYSPPGDSLSPDLFAHAMHRLTHDHDLNMGTEIATNFIRSMGEHGETKENSLVHFIGDLAETFHHDVEKFATCFNAFVTLHPHILTGCCNAKVCFQAQCKGWHGDNADSGGVCSFGQSVNSASMPEHIQKCPQCSVALVKSEGCSDVECPMCSHSFTWINGTSSAALARWRGSGEGAAVGAIRGRYVRTTSGWLVRPVVEGVVY